MALVALRVPHLHVPTRRFGLLCGEWGGVAGPWASTLGRRIIVVVLTAVLWRGVGCRGGGVASHWLPVLGLLVVLLGRDHLRLCKSPLPHPDDDSNDEAEDAHCYERNRPVVPGSTSSISVVGVCEFPAMRYSSRRQ